MLNLQKLFNRIAYERLDVLSFVSCGSSLDIMVRMVAYYRFIFMDKYLLNNNS